KCRAVRRAAGAFGGARARALWGGPDGENGLGHEKGVRCLQGENPGARNRLSVAMELQADCYAGVWAFDAARANMLEPGDIDEGLNAAAAVGDDRLQQMGGGRVRPESFTHGSSAERRQWFRRGFESGDPRQCDTFASVGQGR
ncbi:MAG: neutral zinc metallopeptidase, partial [Gemmatimonadaceae bacterium]|nr:neutral zinc metallopeptidase [Gemmatimonadaceae bacterium]